MDSYTTDQARREFAEEFLTTSLKQYRPTDVKLADGSTGQTLALLAEIGGRIFPPATGDITGKQRAGGTAAVALHVIRVAWSADVRIGDVLEHSDERFEVVNSDQGSKNRTEAAALRVYAKKMRAS